MRNIFVAAFLIIFLLVVTSAIPKQKETKCNILSKSCSSRRKCCKGLECAPKGYTTGKRCIEKNSSPSSNEDDAEIMARNNFEMTYTGLFDALRGKAPIIQPSAYRGNFEGALQTLNTVADNLYSKAGSCEFVFNGNTNVMKAVHDATYATSHTALIQENNIGQTALDLGPASAILSGMQAQAGWLNDALNAVSSFTGCDASAIATSKAKFDASVTEAINSLM